MSRARAIALIATLGLTAGALVTGAIPAGAAPGNPIPPNDSSSGKVAPTRTPVAPSEAQDCTLRSGAHRSELHEWGSCIAVNASLSSAPAIGQTATLTYEVTAAVARPDATVKVELPDGLTFAGTPAGARLEAGTQSDGTGAAVFALTTTDLTAGATARFSTPVRATGAGLKQITVTANADAPWGIDGAADDVFLTVGAAGVASRFGGDVSATGGVATAPGLPELQATNGEPKVASITLADEPRTDDASGQAAPDGAAANTCASGTWSYFDDESILRPSINYVAQAWDQDSATEDDLLASQVTTFSGTYNLCFDGADGEGGPQEVYIKFVSSNSTWRLRNTPASDDSYVNSTGVVTICDGCTHSFGSLIPGNDIHRGMHAFDSANDMWSWMPHACWDRDGVCRQAIINWTATSVDGTYYSPGGNDVHLAANDPNAPHTVVHEMTHSTMDDVYDDDYPPAPNCNPHFIPSVSSTGCAFTEGFAEWVPAAVYNDPFYRWPDGGELNLETPTWGSAGWDNGEAVEGRVAGAMIDIADSANELYFDRWSESDPGAQWDTFQNYSVETFDGFWFGRQIDGYNTANSGANGSVYQNTIDQFFRDPLSAFVGLTRPTPVPHNYRFDTSSLDWSLVAARPPSGSDYDLDLFDDSSQGVLLDSSTFGGSLIDFVAVDSNHRALGDYYPRVRVFNGSGNYLVEYVGSTGSLGSGTSSVSLLSNDLAAVRDISLTAGVPVGIRVVPTNGGQNADLALMDSDPATAATWVRGRFDAVATSSSGGAGATEQLLYTPAASDTFGFVLVNGAGSGSYTLYVDTSAPTGTLQINDGAAKTRDRLVDLAHLVSDPQTGLDQMRVSIDGVMDSEPWVPFAATSTVTLPTPDGTKTVRTQYRNRAGLTTGVLSDTIVLDRRADLTTTKVSKPPRNRERGAMFDITDTVKNVGTFAATPTITRYYLSVNQTLGPEDIAFAASRDVPSLDNGETSEGTTEVTVKNTTPLGKHYVLACADGTEAIAEYGEGNNCKASKRKVNIKAASDVAAGLLR